MLTSRFTPLRASLAGVCSWNTLSSRASPLSTGMWGAERVVQGAVRAFQRSKVGVGESRALSNNAAAWTLGRLTGRENILLMGAPGSGKSSVGRILSQRLGLPVLDVDDDVLEVAWGTSVAAKLAALGDEAFLDAEAVVTQALEPHVPTIISLSGSNPLRPEAVAALRRKGVCVLLDVANEDILRRMHHMKTDRIVGCSADQSEANLRRVIEQRAGAYNACYDLRVLVHEGVTAEQVAGDVLAELSKRQVYVSTRGDGEQFAAPDVAPTTTASAPAGAGAGAGAPIPTFLRVVSQGLASDKGLFVPLDYTPFTTASLERMVGLSYQQKAQRVIEKFPLGRMKPQALHDMINEAYASFADERVLPVSHLEGNHYLMETFHGPTASFKDLSLQLTPKILTAAAKSVAQEDGFSRRSKVHTGLIVATSGDTGCAALNGFGREARTPIVVLYPTNGVSMVQKAQMRTAEGDVHVIGVNGDFDDCQSYVKSILNDDSLRAEFQKRFRVRFSSGNSINWGRFLPQVAFTFGSYTRLVEDGVIAVGDKADVCIPTGNFGNILGAWYAKQMGLPLDKIVCASNDNNVLFDFINSGVYDLRARAFRQTISPSIDILVSSNLERFLYLLHLQHFSAGSPRGADPAEARQKAHAVTKELFERLHREQVFEVSPEILKRLQGEIVAGWSDQDACKSTIKRVFDETGRLIDPHTAVAKNVADAMDKAGTLDGGSKPLLISSTAHYQKFPDSMLAALDPELTAGDQVQSLVKNGDIRGLYKILSEVAGPRSDQYRHKRLEEVASLEPRHHTTCPADLGSVVDSIKAFLGDRKHVRS